MHFERNVSGERIEGVSFNYIQMPAGFGAFLYYMNKCIFLPYTRERERDLWIS